MSVSKKVLTFSSIDDGHGLRLHCEISGTPRELGDGLAFTGLEIHTLETGANPQFARGIPVFPLSPYIKAQAHKALCGAHDGDEGQGIQERLSWAFNY